MKDYKKAIEEASLDYAHIKFGEPKDWTPFETSEVENVQEIRVSFIKGAKSEAAKEFHQQGMYSEEEVKKLVWLARGFYCYHRDTPFSRLGNHFRDWFKENKKK